MKEEVKIEKKFWSWGKKLRLRSKDKDINILVWIVEHSHTLPNCASCARTWCADILPKLDLVFDLSIIALLLGLLRTDLFAREMSAVTLVIDILCRKTQDRERTCQCNVMVFEHFTFRGKCIHQILFSAVYQQVKVITEVNIHFKQCQLASTTGNFYHHHHPKNHNSNHNIDL